MTPARLSTTVVTYHPDRVLLERALRSLGVAIDAARSRGLLSTARIFVVDNGGADSLAAAQACVGALHTDGASIELVHGHGNVGYGRANNLVLPRLESDFHLVMNPDVELDAGCLAAAIEALNADPRIGMVAPDVCGSTGERQYLCRRYPSAWVLFLRGFAPAAMRRAFAATLDRYEMRDVLRSETYRPVPLASGCFMVVRTELFRRLGGFDPRFFMYFEDYDLSLRVGREAEVAFVPASRIVHHGGDAARKGPRHLSWFIRSAWRFFATHGWKVA